MYRHADWLIEIGGRIRKTRFARGVSMKIAHEIRQKYGVKLDPSYLSRIERGKTEIPLRTLFAISDYFGIKPAQLIDFSNVESSRGTEYIFMDPELVQYLSRLRDVLGEENARTHLQDLLKDILKLLEAALPEKSVLQAARPQEKTEVEENVQAEIPEAGIPEAGISEIAAEN